MEKRREKTQLKSFLRDMHSPCAEAKKGGAKISKKTDRSIEALTKRARAEAEEVAKIENSLGLELVVPFETLAHKVEANFENCDGKRKTTRGDQEVISQ